MSDPDPGIDDETPDAIDDETPDAIDDETPDARDDTPAEREGVSEPTPSGPPGGELGGRSPEPDPPSRFLQLVDALYYALGIVVVAGVLSAALAFPTGAGWVGVKFGLFVLGMFAFGIAAVQLRPTPAWRDEPRFSIEPDGETPFQATIQRLPPLSGQLAPDQRLSVAARLFLGAVLTLATSFLMEAVLGVGVPTA